MVATYAQLYIAEVEIEKRDIAIALHAAELVRSKTAREMLRGAWVARLYGLLPGRPSPAIWTRWNSNGTASGCTRSAIAESPAWRPRWSSRTSSEFARSLLPPRGLRGSWVERGGKSAADGIGSFFGDTAQGGDTMIGYTSDRRTSDKNKTSSPQVVSATQGGRRRA